MLRQPSENPLIAIVGATGTGKSELAVSLAQRFRGEVINGDALQLYNGLPVVTNKIPLLDRKGIPHHLLGCVELDEEPWQVGKYLEQARRAILEVRSRGNLPILVGGTHYYTQALLFKDAVVDDDAEQDQHVPPGDEEKRWPILGASTEDILEKLREVDPSIAIRWHPKDRRKIRRSLGIWLKTGRKASDVYEEQRQRRANNVAALWETPGQDNGQGRNSANDILPTTSTLLRFPTLIFWVHTSSDALVPRLNDRVEKMMSNGLLSEVESMQTSLFEQEAQGCTVDQTRGIWVAIGYKEFTGYLSALKTGNVSPEELGAIRKDAIERTKVATRQYAKRQIRWIRNQLLRTLRENGLADRLYILNSSDLLQWPSAVEKMACELTASFLEGTNLPDPSQLSGAARNMLSHDNGADTPKGKDFQTRHCPLCNTTLMTEGQWIEHVKSRKHRKAAKGVHRPASWTHKADA
ncbi:tRNA isopentenyltransferase [Lasallia pustulata]|uniref:tRNA dimethylallyltransferase n=1 Tax=Lasallia pustulata TaxID=136370 RepID=A0A1W5CY64_9LECA|nr:tRNA isopentenyltransferase [Lasallia pustulata]